MLLPVVFPELLITPQGRSAPNLFTRNRKTLLTYRLLRRHQNNIIVCIYLCGQFLKTRKVATKTIGKSALSLTTSTFAHKSSPVRGCPLKLLNSALT